MTDITVQCDMCGDQWSQLPRCCTRRVPLAGLAALDPNHPRQGTLWSAMYWHCCQGRGTPHALGAQQPRAAQCWPHACLAARTTQTARGTAHHGIELFRRARSSLRTRSEISRSSTTHPGRPALDIPGQLMDTSAARLIFYF